MKDLIIIGARGFGRELYDLATQCTAYNKEWTIKGYLDDKQDALEGYDGFPPILGPVETYEVQPNDVFVCALGSIEFKKKYVNIILEKGGKFTNIIHPTAVISNLAKIGTGFIISAFSYVSCNVTIGDFVTIQTHTGIGHDGVVKDWAVINAYVFLGGFCEVGEGTFVGPGAKVIPYKKLGDYSTVGIGSVVMKNVKPNVTVFGSPAKEIF